MESTKTKKASSAKTTRNSDDVTVDKIKFPLYLYPDTMDIVNALYEHDNCGSKTEFIEKAVRFYCGYLLNKEHTATEFIAPQLAAITEGIVRGSEQNLSRAMFKIAVELGALTHMEENSKTSLCVLLSMYAGLRVGEVCALKWTDIDLEKSILTVNRTVQRIRTMSSECATTISIGMPKSRSSMRQIPLPEFLADILNHFNHKNDSYVLSGSERIIEPRTMQYRFKSILKKANLPSINYHALRHMFATNCIMAGFDVKTLSELLGHCSVETTLNRYVHSSIERKAECMNLLTFAA